MKDELFLNQYLYSKLLHSGRYEFYLNFSDISMDLRPYLEANFFDYININYIDVKDTQVDEKTLKHLNMLNRNYINKYTWVRRDDFLRLLKEKSKELGYKLATPKKDWLLERGMNEATVSKIKNRYMEWKVFSAYRVPKNKNCINEGLIKSLHEDIASKINELNLKSDFLFDFNFNLTVKSKKKKNYYSGRAYNSLCFSKNDLEEKVKNYWEKQVVDEREKRSDVFDRLRSEGYFIIDLGDMASNFPNMLNCVKTGKYLDIDFHSKIAQEQGVERSVAKMAAVRCCFNSRKVDVLYGLLEKADLSKLEPEIKEMLDSGIFRLDGRSLKLNRGRKMEDAHEFFSDRKENSFFKYCCDFLTSWDVCSVAYKNDLAPSDLSMLTSAVEISVIYDAMQQGKMIVNAYDHAYLISKDENDYYDWKGNYCKYAEEIVKCYKEPVKDKKIRSRSSLKMDMGNPMKKGMRNALKEDIRNYLKNHTIEDAAIHYGWKPQWKYYWKKLYKEGKI